MVTFEDLRAIILALPGTVETMSWDARAFKVNGRVMLWWNPRHDCPVFEVPMEERDLLLEADPETFFTTDHHRGSPLILARPARLARWAGCGGSSILPVRHGGGRTGVHRRSFSFACRLTRCPQPRSARKILHGIAD